MHVKIWKVREHVDVRVRVVVRTNDRSSYRIRGRGWCSWEGISRNLSFHLNVFLLHKVSGKDNVSRLQGFILGLVVQCERYRVSPAPKCAGETSALTIIINCVIFLVPAHQLTSSFPFRFLCSIRKFFFL